MRAITKVVAVAVMSIAVTYLISGYNISNAEYSYSSEIYCAGFDGQLLDNLPVICTTSEEYKLIVHIVMAEAEGEPFEGKIAVANTVINRVRNRGMSIEEVIFQPYQYCTGYRFKLKPTEECYRAVDAALSGYEAVGRDVEYFCENSITFDYLDYVTSIGSHDFYKDRGEGQ